MAKERWLRAAATATGLALAFGLGGGTPKSPTRAEGVNNGITVDATPTPSQAAGSALSERAVFPAMQEGVRDGDKWLMTDGDGNEKRVGLPEGFTPDSRLVLASNIKLNQLRPNLNRYRNWERALNTERAEGDELAGYNYDYNDFCPTADFRCNVQGDMYAWRVFQGQEVEVPGIGRLEGGEGRSVVLLFLNSTPDVVAWDNDEAGQALVKRGFTATGRLFDANPYGDKFANAEENLLGHWLFRQANGTPEKSYIGVTDNPDNANSTLFAVVVRNQWGNNEDGTPRYQNQLLDAGVYEFGNK